MKRMLVLSVVALISACDSVPNPAQPTAAGGAALSGQAQTARSTDSLLAAVRNATADFHDVDKAVSAGYLAPNAAACVESPAGAMGVHAVNPALTQDGMIDPLKPEVLLYLPKTGGGFRLVGVEYFQPVILRSPQGVVAPWFAAAAWPPTYQVVNAAPTLFGRVFDGPMAGHEPGMPWHWDLHAWAWSPNPNGDLAQFNPRLSCQGTD